MIYLWYGGLRNYVSWEDIIMFTAIGNKQPALLNLLDTANQTKTKTKMTKQQQKHNNSETPRRTDLSKLLGFRVGI